MSSSAESEIIRYRNIFDRGENIFLYIFDSFSLVSNVEGVRTKADKSMLKLATEDKKKQLSRKKREEPGTATLKWRMKWRMATTMLCKATICIRWNRIVLIFKWPNGTWRVEQEPDSSRERMRYKKCAAIDEIDIIIVFDDT